MSTQCTGKLTESITTENNGVFGGSERETYMLKSVLGLLLHVCMKCDIGEIMKTFEDEEIYDETLFVLTAVEGEYTMHRQAY